MAGKLILDTIQTEATFLQMNVGTTRIATMNASGIYSNTGTKMIGTDGTIGVATIANTAIDGVITGSQIANTTISASNLTTSLNLATNNVQVASIQTATGTPAITFAANGQITTANTPFILTGGQIQFPSTSIASGDGNCLDDYEEGTWTPTLGSSGATSGQTYSSQDGRYVKVGQIVMATFDLRMSNKGTLNGDILIAGLPFASKGGGYYGGGMITNWDALATSWIYLTLRIQNNGTAAVLAGRATAGTSIGAPGPSDIGNSTILMGTIMYQTAV